MRLVRIRITFSVFIFILFVLLFFCGEKTAIFLSGYLLPLQFVPALLHTISSPQILFVIGLIFIVCITFIFGRVYCSFLCPLGALQDFFIALSRKFGWHKIHSYQKPLSWLRYPILALTVALSVFGSLTLVNLLDPYSLAGRIINHLFEPVFVAGYNTLIKVPKLFHVYFFFKETAFVPFSLLLITLFFFILILFMSARNGRLYCNSVCPVGTLLGLISRFSLFKFVIAENICSECSRCETVCKAGCIDPRTKTVDHSRCVCCFNCIASCPLPAINYKTTVVHTSQSNWSPQRRGFVIGSIAAVGAIFLVFNNRIRATLASSFPNQKHPITPPGSVSIERFTQFCSACHLCVSACPTKVLTPSLIDYGISGFMQPLMNFDKSFCDYDCNTCGRVCPTGAILPLKLEDKKTVQIGKAMLLENICVVYTDHKNCGACGEVCPTHAISFIDKENILYPKVNITYCIGCGACQLVCPTTPKSIIIEPIKIHQTAIKFRHSIRKQIRRQQEMDSFPF